MESLPLSLSFLSCDSLVIAPAHSRPLHEVIVQPLQLASLDFHVVMVHGTGTLKGGELQVDAVAVRLVSVFSGFVVTYFGFVRFVL